MFLKNQKSSRTTTVAVITKAYTDLALEISHLELSNHLTATRNAIKKLAACAGAIGLLFCSNINPAIADTASFTTEVTGNPGDVGGFADGRGVLISPGETVSLLLSSPFALFANDGFTPINNNVSIFALSDIGSALVDISFGRYNNGNPDLIHTQRFSAGSGGNSVNFAFLAFVGCGNVAGCDFIQFTGVNAFNGSGGVRLDAITFSNVALASVTGRAPEPRVWALMILAFVLISWRAKATRSKILPKYKVPALKLLDDATPAPA